MAITIKAQRIQSDDLQSVPVDKQERRGTEKCFAKSPLGPKYGYQKDFDKKMISVIILKFNSKVYLKKFQNSYNNYFFLYSSFSRRRGCISIIIIIIIIIYFYCCNN